MGNSATKIMKTEKQITQDLKSINEITKSKYFEKRAGVLIDFAYDGTRCKIHTLLVLFILLLIFLNYL
jgi:hypothetical protein